MFYWLNYTKKRRILFGTIENNLFFYHFIGWSCYFAQGNSNSLNTIQISSGLVGINELNQILICILLISVTYSSNIYWFLIMCKNVILFEKEQKIEVSCDNLQEKFLGFTALIDMSCLSLYSVNAYFQKEHLFVWSVFAPKLIYMLSYLLIKIMLVGFYRLSSRAFLKR